MPSQTRSPGQESKGAVELAVAMTLSGTIGVFVVQSGASTSNVVFFRCVFGALALGLYCLVRGFFRDHGFTLRKLAMAAAGGVFIVLNWTLLFASYSRTSISVATVVYHTQPFYVVLLGALLFRDQLTRAKIGWLVVAFLGLILVSGITPSDLHGAGHSYAIGVGEALLAAVFYAFATVITKRISGVRPHLIALVQVLLGIVLLAPFANFAQAGQLGARWGWLIGIGVIHTCVMYILMYSSYQKLPTPKIAVLAFIYPAVAMFSDWIVYGHHISPVQALGVPMIAAASLGVTLGWKVPARIRLTRPVIAPIAPAAPLAAELVESDR
jgi:drug/metabolite transporter (DMT)-like permease